MAIGRDKSILEFVAKHPYCNKTKVINYINPGSPVPTHKAINRLVKEKKIICTHDKFNSSIHRLCINNKNSYNIIDQLLSKMHTMLEKIHKQKANRVGYGQVLGGYRQMIMNDSPRFRRICDDVLHDLLIKTDKIIYDKNDCLDLNVKIIDLLKELDATFYQPSRDRLTSVDSVLANGETITMVHSHSSSKIFLESKTDIESLRTLMAIVDGFQPNLD